MARWAAGSVAAGVVLVVVGVSGVAGLIALTNCLSLPCEVWLMRLGLAGSAMMSALFQMMALVCGWLVWRATRRRI